MNILVTIDDNYVTPLLVMINSLFKNNKKVRISIYVAYVSLSKKNKKAIHDLIVKEKGYCRFLLINEDKIAKFNTQGHITATAYIRLFVSKELPLNIHKILYLDPDIIICGNIEKLYNKKIGSNCFAACPDIQGNRIEFPSRRDLGLSLNSIYFNTGVLLMNIDCLRSEDTWNELITYLSVEKKFRYHDQDIINDLYRNRICPISCSYNYSSRRGDEFYDRVLPAAQKYCDKRKKYIIHYLGSKKPWKPHYDGRFAYRYLIDAIAVANISLLNVIIFNCFCNLFTFKWLQNEKK